MLDNDQKTQIIQQRLHQFEVEKYQHELNRETAIELGMPTDDSDIVIEQLTKAIKIHLDKLTQLGVTGD